MQQQTTPEILKRRIENGESVHLLDVRRQEEWDAGHIEGAIHIPLHELEQRIGELEHLRDQELIVYCRSGNRSAQACMFLEMMDFKNPVNLKGGLLSW